MNQLQIFFLFSFIVDGKRQSRKKFNELPPCAQHFMPSKIPQHIDCPQYMQNFGVQDKVGKHPAL